MSVVSRLEDAEVLLKAGRVEGALLQVITAISGTSRRRFPRPQTPSAERPGQPMPDGEAFRSFLDTELRNVGIGVIQFNTPKGPRSLGSVLYDIFRMLADSKIRGNLARVVGDRCGGIAAA